MLRIVSPFVWTKNWFLTASYFCKLSLSICVCYMVYFASSQHVDEPRCIARYFALIHVLQNLHEPSASNSSCDNKQFIFAQIYKQWLFLSSTAHSRSLYFVAAYRLAIICLVCKNQKMKHSPTSYNKLARKSKKSKISKLKNSRARQWSHFLSRSDRPCVISPSAIFCSSTRKQGA